MSIDYIKFVQFSQKLVFLVQFFHHFWFYSLFLLFISYLFRSSLFILLIEVFCE